MRLAALVPHLEHVSYRYRWQALEPEFTRRGWQCEAIALGTGVGGRLRALRQASQADVVVLLRKLLPIWQLVLLRSRTQRLVFDLDDAVYLRDSNTSKHAYSRLRLGRYWATIEAADLVTCGNRQLASTAARFTRRSKVLRVPTCVEPHRYSLAAHRAVGADCRLVWIGSRATLPSLHDAREQLAAATRSLPGLTMTAICDRTAVALPILVQPRAWSSATEARDLAASDIGLSWLPAHPWSDGKCGLKVLQYMAAGLPVVANPHGIHPTLVRHGETGLLAETPAEFAWAVNQLANNPELRRRMGQAGRRLVEQSYSVATWGPRLAALLRRVVSPRVAAPLPGTDVQQNTVAGLHPAPMTTMLPHFETKRDSSCTPVA